MVSPKLYEPENSNNYLTISELIFYFEPCYYFYNFLKVIKIVWVLKLFFNLLQNPFLQ